MRELHETLDQYLDDLDRIKEQVAEETAGLDAREVQAYFAKSGKELERLTGKKLRVRRPVRRTRASKLEQYVETCQDGGPWTKWKRSNYDRLRVTSLFDSSHS